jgi:hypothetical protein
MIAGCGTAQPDAGDARGDADAGADADPSCHWDCLGGPTCEEGVATRRVHAPVPCAVWTGECPVLETVTCARGCRTDGVTMLAPSDRAELLCEELRPKVAGDPCTEDAHCWPVRTVGEGETADRDHLECDEASGACVSVPDPRPSDFFGPCDVDVAPFFDTEDPPVIGALADASCEEGACIVVERATCVRTACTLPCESDSQCPDGTVCHEVIDLGAGGAPGTTRVCGPAAGVFDLPTISECR